MVDIVPAKNVVVLKEPPQQKSKSGLVLPKQEGRQKPEIGIVVKIGTGVKPLEFKIGDMIVYKKYMENEVSYQGSAYNFVEFKDVVGVIREAKDENNS